MSRKLGRKGHIVIAITIMVAMLLLCIYCKKAQEPEPETIYQPKSFPGAAAPRRGGLRD